MAARPRAPYPRSARMTEMLTITPLDGEGDFAAYCARPEGTPRAAIIVIQEIFGVNAGVRRKCDRLAEAGYLALAQSEERHVGNECVRTFNSGGLPYNKKK